MNPAERALIAAKTVAVYCTDLARIAAVAGDARSLNDGLRLVRDLLGRASSLIQEEGRPKAAPRLRRVRAPRPPRETTAVETVQAPSRAPSAWDPDPAAEQIDATRCRALLLEVVRRAAHDWVLYRTNADPVRKSWARDAFIWLFEEEPGTAPFHERMTDGFPITGFLLICEVLDLDPGVVRSRVRELTIDDVMKSGRPPENRRRRGGAATEDVSYNPHGVTDNVDIDSLDVPDPKHLTSYESHFATNQLGFL